MKKTLYLFTGAFLITQSVTAEAMISISTTLGGSRGPNPIVYNEMAMAQQRHQQEQAIAREQENRTRREREAREGRDRAVESARVERERVEQERVQRVERERVELFRVAENQNRQVQLTFELEGIKQLQRLHRAHHAEQKIRDTEDSEKLKKLKTEGAIRIAQRQAMYDAWCFPGETPICVAEGQSQRIDTLEVGDFVESYDSKSGKSECRRVEQIFQNTVDHLTVLSFGKRILRTTDNHPFYLPKTAQWVQARDLRVGDRLQTVSGEEVEIDKIGEEVGNVRVFNFGVKDTHTYYAHGVLVHNCNNIAKLEIKAVGSGVRGAGVGEIAPGGQSTSGLGVKVVGAVAEALVATPVGQVVLGVGTAALIGHQIYQAFKTDSLDTGSTETRIQEGLEDSKGTQLLPSLPVVLGDTGVSEDTKVRDLGVPVLPMNVFAESKGDSGDTNESSRPGGSGNTPLNEPPRSSGPVFPTNSQAAVKAKELGYTKINERVNGQSVFKKGNHYITRDVDGHNGGAWKAAESVEGLARKGTRLGTYDSNLNRIKD